MKRYIVLGGGLLIIGVIFSFTTALLTTIPHYKKEINEKPLLQFTNFKGYEIRQEGIESFYYGTVGRHFSQYDDFFQLRIERKLNHIEQLKSPYARLTKKSYHLYNPVEYSQEDGTAFVSKEATYEPKTREIIVKTPFTLIMPQAHIEGDNLNVNRNKKTIVAQNIKARYKIEEEQINP